LVIRGWLIMGRALAWLLFIRFDRPPVTPPAALAAKRSASVTDADG
jgi:hypothetical protein